MVNRLDKLHCAYKFTHLERKKISYNITELCEDLIEPWDYDELKLIYNKYSYHDFDYEIKTMEPVRRKFLKTMLETQLGIKLDDKEIDVSDPKATMQRVAVKIMGGIIKPQPIVQQLGDKEDKEEEEEILRISTSIHSTYTQLAARLDPDREQDLAERQRKIELMQKANIAYNYKDLLQLLDLQLSAEQIDPNNVRNIADNKIKHYNKILQNQCNALKEETDLIASQAKFILRVSQALQLEPEQLATMLQEKIAEAKKELAKVEDDLTYLVSARQLKFWLKDQNLPTDDADFNLFDMPEM
jgi:hypothetical protein